MHSLVSNPALFASALALCSSFAAAPLDAQTPASIPSFLLRVGKAGTVTPVPMGITADHARKVAALLFARNEERRIRALKNMQSELGPTKVPVKSFFLGRFPVTNEQYLRYVKAKKTRFPFHWWREGQPDSFNELRPVAHKQFPKNRHASIEYWSVNWKDLPYAIPTGQEKQPVRFISFLESMRYAAWIGMRLPNEPEWTFAANGGLKKEYVFGETWSDKVPESVGIKIPQRAAMRPVGTMGLPARGPFGHDDLFGQVWELVIPMGYAPQTGADLFEAQVRKLRRKEARIKDSPDFSDRHVIAKGGSIYSFIYENWVEMRINCRAKVWEYDVIDGVGFRVAKTARPAYDMTYARMRVDRPTVLLGAQEPMLDRQVGIEQYELESEGQVVKSYNAVSFVPLDHLSAKGADKNNFLAKSQAIPQEVGVIISTEPLESPSVGPGIHVVYMRPAGVPRALVDALKKAKKALTAQAKARAKKEAAAKKAGKKLTEEDEEDEKDKGPQRWRKVLRPFGYSDKEVLEKTVTELTRYVYVLHHGKDIKVDRRFKVDTSRNIYLIREPDGRWLTTIPSARFCTKSRSGGEPTVLDNAANPKQLDIAFSVAATRKDQLKTSGKHWRFTISIVRK